MTTEQQVKVWQCLPKDVRVEIQSRYNGLKSDANNLYYSKTSRRKTSLRIDEIEYIFSEHNLTSDTEPEEMLMVERKKVQEMRSYNLEVLKHDPTHKGAILLEQSLKRLFGNKCLPDKEEQAKPKFEVGQLVKCEGKVCRVLEYNYGREFPYLIYKPYNNAKIYVLESDLEPYTEESGNNKEESGNNSEIPNQEKNDMEEKELNCKALYYALCDLERASVKVRKVLVGFEDGKEGKK